MVEAAALTAINRFLINQNGVVLLEDVLQKIERGTKIITEDLWMATIESNGNTVDTGAVDIEIIGAFENPRLVFDLTRNIFRVEEKQWPMLGTASDKVRV